MRKSYKASNFLDTINKYTKRKHSETLEDIKKQEEMELRKAEEEIIEDANAMINKELIAMKNKVSIEVSRKELAERKKFFRRRKEIMEDMFKECHKRLVDFSVSEKYKEFLNQYAKAIGNYLNSSDIVLFVKEEDLKYKDMICEAFEKPCEIAVDRDILIGGIKGYSRSLGIIADETLDAKLKEQLDWAAEEFGILLV